jgi:D-psicose/D-tagatose/L-ribulose 3-epimerase
MPKFGAHAFIWAGDWSDEGAEKVIGGAAAAGLDFVEVCVLHPASFNIPHTKALLEHYNIGATCSLGLPKDTHLPAHPEKARVFLEDALRVTHGIGATALSGAIYTHLGTLTGAPPRADELTSVVMVLKSVAKSAASLGLEIGIEAINRYENYLINLASQALEIVDRIDEPNAFVHLDTYHMNIEEKGFFKPIISTGSKMRYIHLSESDRGTPGTGNVHWDEVFKGLKAINYDGALVMESFAAINPDIAGATCMWRDVVGDPQALVRDGLAFLRGKAREHGVMQ